MPSYRLSELAAAVGGVMEGREDPLILGAAGLREAGPDHIAFVSEDALLQQLKSTKAGAVILKPGPDCPRPAIRVEDPYGAFAAILQRFATEPGELFPVGIHPTALVDPSARVADGVSIGPYCVVGPRVEIGAGSALASHVTVEKDVQIGPECVIYQKVTLIEGTRIGQRVILHPHVVIGSDGFGYLPRKGRLRKIPQIGRVVLEDEVEIGAGSCVDRATTGSTLVAAGTKIDNLVQVGHNVVIGRDCAIAAQTGLAGSVTVGDGVLCGGQVGIADHLTIGDGATLAAKTGVTKDVPAGQTMFWYPAFGFRYAYRLIASLRKLPEILERLRRLENEFRDARGHGKDSEQC